MPLSLRDGIRQFPKQEPIDAVHHAQLFDEFYQVDEPASQKYAGAGLGLSLIRDLIVLLNGEISISSEVGVGTTVRFQIPVQVV